jgi:hypothetical protein
MKNILSLLKITAKKKYKNLQKESPYLSPAINAEIFITKKAYNHIRYEKKRNILEMSLRRSRCLRRAPAPKRSVVFPHYDGTLNRKAITTPAPSDKVYSKIYKTTPCHFTPEQVSPQSTCYETFRSRPLPSNILTKHDPFSIIQNKTLQNREAITTPAPSDKVYSKIYKTTPCHPNESAKITIIKCTS